MIDLDAIKARWKASAARRQGAEGSLLAMRSASDVPALVAEVERLRAEVEGLTDAYDSLKSDADAVVGGLKDDYAGLVAEVERLKAHIGAILDHGMTTWGDTSCGRGGAGGQAMTTTAHPEVIQHLALSALHGVDLKEAADQYAAMLPNAARLDEKPRPARRAGADGRPA